MVDALKEQHYTLQLQLALTAGHWESATPAKTPKGIHLSWSELFRKLRKHTRRADVVEASSQTHYLSLLLRATRVTFDGADEDSRVSPFQLGNECILPEERREDAQKAYDTLKQIGSSDQSVLLTLAYYAYALEQPGECLSHLSSISSFDIHPSSEKNIEAERSMSSMEGSSAASPSVLVNEGALCRLMEAMRNYCLEGMSNERLSSNDPLIALSSYEKGLQLLSSNSIARSPSTRSGKASFESFTKYRELWRWTERLLWRNIVLSAKHRSIESTLQNLRVYATHSIHWPPSFRATRRATICSIHLRALIALSSHPHSVLFVNKAVWMNESRSVILECRAILSASTNFPSAGERNVPVEEFVDLCVAIWEAGGSISEQTSWVLDILWWATRLTFNSPRILRHMTRLLHISGDDDLARRTLKLYVQIVSKARETANGDKERPSIAEPVSLDSDQNWVDTLVQGARMLCRIQGGVAEARQAAELVEKARQRVGGLGEEYEAKVDLADGVCKSVLAMREHESSSRGKLLSQSLELILTAISKNPTASAHYHAALAYSRPTPERNLDRAVAHCRHAIESDSKEIRYWHLLALLETKIGEWKKAQGVLDAANDMVGSLEAKEPVDESVNARDLVNGNVNASRNGTSTPGRSSPNETVPGDNDDNTALQEPLLSSTDNDLPSASTLLQAMPDHPPSNEREQFESALQLRMTQIALVELVDGQETIENSWLSLFEWYAKRRDLQSSGLYKPSMDSTRLSSEFEMVGRHSFESHTADSQQMIPSASITTTDMTRASTDAQTVTPPRASVSLEATPEVPEIVLPESPSRRSFKDKVTNRAEGRRTHSQSISPERDRDTSKGKRVQKMLKDQVHKQSARINTFSKKIGHGVARSSGSILHRASSAPDFHAVLTRTGPYQASSIHSRKRVISWGSRSRHYDPDRSVLSPSPPPPPSLPPLQAYDPAKDIRSKRERRMVSNLWVMSAASFRRIGKIDQAAAAIREAELLDEENEAVWVQLGLYFAATGEESKAIESFHKALFIAPEDASAMIHLSHIYLTSQSPSLRSPTYGAVDLATGMLESLTHGTGWDIPEAWYLLAKAYGMQGRKGRERECLTYALSLSEVRGIRDTGSAVGWCL